MRGRDVSEFTAPLDRLFLQTRARKITTIGVGDGGNEVGMANLRDLVEKYVPNGSLIAASVSCDHLISAGCVVPSLLPSC